MLGGKIGAFSGSPNAINWIQTNTARIKAIKLSIKEAIVSYRVW